MAILPATGSQKSFGRVRRGYSNQAPAAGQNISLRGTLGAYLGISSGSISLSQTFGGRTTPYNDQ